jgi:hypothetical protein
MVFKGTPESEGNDSIVLPSPGSLRASPQPDDGAELATPISVHSRLDPDAERFMRELSEDNVTLTDTIDVVASDGKALTIPYGVAQRSRVLRWKKRMQMQGQESSPAPARRASDSAASAAEGGSPIRLHDPSCTEANVRRVSRYLQLVAHAEAGEVPGTALLAAEQELLREAGADDRGLLDLLAVAAALEVPELSFLAARALAASHPPSNRIALPRPARFIAPATPSAAAAAAAAPQDRSDKAQLPPMAPMAPAAVCHVPADSPAALPPPPLAAPALLPTRPAAECVSLFAAGSLISDRDFAVMLRGAGCGASARRSPGAAARRRSPAKRALDRQARPSAGALGALGSLLFGQTGAPDKEPEEPTGAHALRPSGRGARRKRQAERGEDVDALCTLNAGGARRRVATGAGPRPAEGAPQRLLTEDGAHYVGATAAGLPHGRGIEHYLDGDRYRGEFRLGKRHGRGAMRWGEDGSAFDGTWHAGMVCPGRRAVAVSGRPYAAWSGPLPSAHMLRAREQRASASLRARGGSGGGAENGSTGGTGEGGSPDGAGEVGGAADAHAPEGAWAPELPCKPETEAPPAPLSCPARLARRGGAVGRRSAESAPPHAPGGVDAAAYKAEAAGAEEAAERGDKDSALEGVLRLLGGMLHGGAAPAPAAAAGAAGGGRGGSSMLAFRRSDGRAMGADEANEQGRNGDVVFLF